MIKSTFEGCNLKEREREVEEGACRDVKLCSERRTGSGVGEWNDLTDLK